MQATTLRRELTANTVEYHKAQRASGSTVPSAQRNPSKRESNPPARLMHATPTSSSAGGYDHRYNGSTGKGCTSPRG